MFDLIFVSFIFIRDTSYGNVDLLSSHDSFQKEQEEIFNNDEYIYDYDHDKEYQQKDVKDEHIHHNSQEMYKDFHKDNLQNSFKGNGTFDFPSTYVSTSALPSIISPLESSEYRLLYFMPFCPLSRKIFIGLREKGIAFQEFYEKTWDPSKTLLKLNPLGELPVFVDHQQICQNDFVICEYLEEVYKDPNSLMGRTVSQRGETRFIMSWFDRIFYYDVYWTLFYERSLKRQAKHGFPDTALLKKGRESLKQHMNTLEYWTQQRSYLNGYRFSWADVAGVAHLSCIDYLGDIHWNDYPWTKEWYLKIKSRPSVRPCLDWYFPGLSPCEHYGSLDF